MSVRRGTAIAYGESDITVGGFIFALDVVVKPPRPVADSDLGLLGYLDALTFRFRREGQEVSCVLVYSEPDPEAAGLYHFVTAADTGYEGIACLDDTSRAVLLALGVYERSRSRRALNLARQWLSFVTYMQYPDGEFANFIRNAAGVRNASGPTSYKGGAWWTARALWALARAFRVTKDVAYLNSYRACPMTEAPDAKIAAVLALGQLELYRADPAEELRSSILDLCDLIVDSAKTGYFRDHADSPKVHLWGYHQLHAVAHAARLLDRPDLLTACRSTVRELIEPDVRERIWYSFPDRSKNGVCAYTVSPIVQGLTEMYAATGAERYRHLALQAAAWFYGRNDARMPMYEPSTGRCRDGITNGVASANCGAESSIEAGLAELERRKLIDAP